MDIQELSSQDILSLQYSILEELKQSKDEKVVISSNNEVTTSLSHSFKNEKKTELISARVKPTAKSIIEDSEHSYSDAIEYFANKLIDDVDETNSINSYKEFILQKFQDNLGNFENQKEYSCRVTWFENSCPTYKELSRITGININSICSYASKYNWSELKDKAFDLGYRIVTDSSSNPQKIFIDITEKKVERNSKEYTQFREAVLRRDNVCQCCGSSKELEVHHALSFKQYNSLGADPNNGIVLCKECHSKYHNENGYKQNVNAVTLAQFLRDYGINTQTQLSVTESHSEVNECLSMNDLLNIAIRGD